MTELKRIMHVEDDPSIQDVVRVALEIVGGFQVNTCSCGQDALDQFDQFQPQLVLLDVMMPGMDGPTTLKQLQQRFGGTILLKGHGSLIAGPEQQLARLDCGNPGMAIGGMGDVLSGIIAALLAQGLDSFNAAALGGYLHGTAADQLAAIRGERGLLPTAILPRLQPLLNGKS